jgi:hypothetical protein
MEAVFHEVTKVDAMPILDSEHIRSFEREIVSPPLSVS